MINWKKLALRTTMNKAKEMYKAGNTVEQIADRFWAEPKVAEGLIVLDVTPEDLLKMIKDKVGEK